MSSFLVLGLVPGTHIQITFLLWIVLASAFATALLARFAKRTHLVRNVLVTSALLTAVRREAWLRPTVVH